MTMVLEFTPKTEGYLKTGIIKAVNQSEGEVNFKFDEVFVLYGKETKGLPEDLLQKYIENTIRIPMRPHLRSLNLSNSVNIITYEILRQANFEGLEETSKYFDEK